MDPDLIPMLGRLLAAALVGGAIGFERSDRGRPAGFRTHTLVALGACLVMQVGIHLESWFPNLSQELIRTDPTRLAEGVMVGVGFLGSGVIFREGLVLRGLTTAASIWVTAALGILAGIGLFQPLVVASLLTLGVLDLLRRFEGRLPVEQHFHHEVRFEPGAALREAEVKALVEGHGFRVAEHGYRLEPGGDLVHVLTIYSRRRDAPGTLAAALVARDDVRGFELMPTGD